MHCTTTSFYGQRCPNEVLIGFPVRLVLIVLVGVVIATSGCSSALQLSSVWRGREILVDGSDADWQGTTAYIKGSNVSLGIRNDSEYLYTCVIAMDRQTKMQMMASGFTVWFDPEGGKNKAFGIHFPLGLQGQPPPVPRQDRNNPEDRTDPEEALKSMEQTQRELEIIGPGEKDRERVLLVQVQGIEAKLGNNHQGFLVYELKVPLRRSANHPYAIGIGNNEAIGIGFETTEPNLEKMKEQMGGAPGGGGMPPGGGGMSGPPGGGGMPPGGGGMGGPPGGGHPGMGPLGGEQVQSLKLWTRTVLATEIASAAK
jgi:hypothetical protein